MLKARAPWLVGSGSGVSLLLLVSIALGAAVGHAAPMASAWLGERVDATLLVLVALLFFGVRFDAIVRALVSRHASDVGLSLPSNRSAALQSLPRQPVWAAACALHCDSMAAPSLRHRMRDATLANLRFMALALVANFVLVPVIGYGIARLVLPDQPLFMVGLVIYFMAPCTDWFLGFVRLARGNVALGTALIPLNMVVQLLLYPLYLQLFTRHAVQVEAGLLASTLLQWFLLPLVLAVAAHYALRALLAPRHFERVLRCADAITPWLIAVLVAEIFAAHIEVILAHRGVFGWLLLAVFVFFIATFVLSEALSRATRLRYPEHALLTMTVAARNAPLMLAVTMAALPDQPLIHAAIVIGMLLEFPHLTLLRQLLLRHPASPSLPLRQAAA